MADGYHPPLEENLEAVYELEEEGTRVIQARLAEHLGHSPPSVSEMVRRLRVEGWVVVRAGGPPHRQGPAPGESVVRKHRLAERLLRDIIGPPWHKTHVEACRWEHAISDEVEERLMAVLDSPATCPHGNPIPGNGEPRDDLRALGESEVGDHVRLELVTEQVEVDFEALTYLDERVHPGSRGRGPGQGPRRHAHRRAGRRHHRPGPGPGVAALRERPPLGRRGFRVAPQRFRSRRSPSTAIIAPMQAATRASARRPVTAGWCRR